MRSTSTNQPDYVITLVHGTFAKNSAWTLESSALCKRLESQLDGNVRFERFSWSGRNLHQDRLAAGVDLQTILLTSMKKWPDASHFIVSHSHGGNVALYAMADSTLQAKLSGIICLNSPFICLLRRTVEQVKFVSMVLFACLLPFPIISVEVMGLESLSEQGWTQTIAIGIGVLDGLLIFAVLKFGVQFLFYLNDRFYSKQERVIKRLQLPTITDIPILCIWSSGDEVIGFFNLLDSLSNLPFLIMHEVFLCIGFLVLIGLHYGNVIPVSLTLPLGLSDSTVRAVLAQLLQFAVSSGVYLAVLIFTLHLTAVLLNLVLCIIPVGLSVLNLVDSLVARISFSMVPLTASRTKFMDVVTRLSILNHSAAYEQPEVLDKMADWMMQSKPE